MENLERKIFDYISARLSPKRFEHSYNVAVFAAELAKIHKINAYKAQVSGLLHDLAKYKTDKELISFFANRQPRPKYFKEIKENAPQLLHGFAAAVIAKEEFKIKDKDILNAISSHTLARENMSQLEKIIIIADYAAEGRKRKELEVLRKLARENLDGAFKAVLSAKLIFVIKNNMWICAQTIAAWNYYGTEKEIKN